MCEINVKTKFDIGDSVYGFPNNELHNLIVDRIEVSIERFSDSKITRISTMYYATTIDSEFNSQYRFKERSLFTEDEIKSYVNDYFKKDK